MWRYRELLPVANEPTVGLQVGFTPLIKADRLAKRLGIRELWIKNDTVNYPSLSFKDRVVSVALSRAKELGFTRLHVPRPAISPTLWLPMLRPPG
jgi:threonine synthase